MCAIRGERNSPAPPLIPCRPMDYRLGIVLVVMTGAFAQVPDAAPGRPTSDKDPAYAFREQAYEAVRTKDWDRAIAAFEKALQAQPGRPDVHKDLAYALLKTGQTEAARDHFKAASDLDPADDHV